MNDVRQQEYDRAWINKCACQRTVRIAKQAREYLRTAVEVFMKVDGNRLTQSDRDDIFGAIKVLIIKAEVMEEIWRRPRKDGREQ